MGQGLGKTAWPKPAGGYQTITSGRCGRRHSYVGFRPFLNNQDRDGHQRNDNCKQLELEDVQKENSLSFSEDSSPLVQVSADLLDEPLSKDAREPVCQSASSQTSEVTTSPFSVFCYGLEDSQISQDLMNPYEKPEDLAEYTSGGHNDLNGKNGIGFVNIDSYEPDSSDGEEEDALDKYSWIREAAGLIQGRLDNILSQCEKEVESLNDIQSQLSAFNHSVYRESCEEPGPIPLACPNNRTLKSAEDEAIPKISMSDDSYETQQVTHIVDVGIGTPIPVADVLNISDGETDQENSSELVVRPKIRKQNIAKQLERENYLPSDNEEENDSWRRIGVADVQQCHPECPLRDGKDEISSGVFFLSRVHSHQKNIEIDLRRNEVAQQQNSVLSDSAFWNEFEDRNTRYLMSHEGEDSSECSDGEWSTSVPSYFTAVEKEQSSSDESWETVSCREEHDPGVQRSSGGAKEESTDFCFQEGEQTFLEEGEIPWLQYREEVESSSDEENDTLSDFVHLGFFLLDGNNNLEDDSSVSEDLDVEWRLLDEFGDGLGLAQAIPYMEPQFLTFMALEGRLEAVETALAQLESLTFDVEQTHPPATKETIDCLPQIIVTGDYNGQEQCCTICCCDFVEGEIITELPCHHLFHKPCVTLWLQRSGTCPVCRHVLAPVLPEAADDTVFFI
ncbi:E3 ubiquitin-protein ligase Praja-2 isoform X1 [Cyanistes caeruleus]|uniref:RING-type E3 ubiquitin transferase n=1 Tax=Cyanistes caeruleus TaxID=156563 RepID=A0A8C0V5D7_CYACU|nr:E3 ubiquitin-protein ligase Praja-2 isoform X1 [Cyanistes caeruleus]XP_023799306.1 E3 ubiquitin-protein ligase Praja-2 isoform X1 [Cyanistes caeruleus]XP_023799307.1 E3 ubiquitin-protein ligase Praja-2 isoform X1 [Cyanistes caeruleus]XP_023799308.1 E3 ubiquitin-protein ligase Praja-2 isoform X1 [Cyanistes caeruleus]XP_023799310.1 E3 ubiquitin-protein ligase Praja-2 isoform X1 [Cyanistes caeruleus]